MKYLFFIFPALLFSQTIKIDGVVIDDSTKNPLAFATIRILESEIVTSSNKEGKFILDCKKGEYTFVVTYVGYYSKNIALEINRDTVVAIGLQPAVIQLPEVTVNSSDEDPAMEIMRNVIKRREKNYEGLKNYEMSGYRKNILYSKGKIAILDEQFVRQIYEPNGVSKDFVLSSHKSDNIKKNPLPISMNIGGSLFFTGSKFSLKMQDNSKNIVFPLDDNALSYYDFKLVNTKLTGSDAVYTIQILPKSSLLPLVKGKIFITDRNFALVGADVETNEGWSLSFIRNFSMKFIQSYANYDGYWIPQFSEVEISGSVNVFNGLISVPEMKLIEVYSASTCKVNGIVPDSVKSARRSRFGGYTADTLKAFTKLERIVKSKNKPNADFQLFEPTVTPLEISKEAMDTLRPLALTESEKIALKELDSTQTLNKTMEVRGSWLFSLFREDSNRTFWANAAIGIAKHGMLHNNRVESVTPGVWFDIDEMNSKIFYRGEIAYATGPQLVEWQAGGGVNFGEDHLDRFDANIWETIKPWSQSRFISKSFNSTVFYSYGIDSYNYLRSSGFNVGVHKYFTDSLFVKFYCNFEMEQSIGGSFNVWSKNKKQTPNPAVNNGKNNSLKLQFGFEPYSPFPFLIQSLTRLVVDADFSLPLIGSDFNFQRYCISGSTRYNTLYSLMLESPYLYIAGEASAIFGNYGIQHLAAPPASQAIYSQSGTLKGKQHYSLVGTSYAMLQVEHNWQTLPFALTGIKELSESKIQIITGGSIANSWNNSAYYIRKNNWKPYWEAYLGFGGVLNIFRFDVVHSSEKINLIKISFSPLIVN